MTEVTKGQVDISKSPAWSVGIVALITALIAGILSLYVAVRPEIQTYLQAAGRKQEIAQKAEESRYEVILRVTENSSKQILELSQQLGAERQSKQDLKVRVDTLERDVARVVSELEVCQKQLLVKR